jgi:hypothetical protein
MDKGTIWGGLGIFIFCLLIALIFWNQKEISEKEIESYKKQIAQMNSLLDEQILKEKERARKESFVLADTSKTDTILSQAAPKKFDPMDKRNFRLYGLFKPKTHEISVRQMAEKYKVLPSSVKLIETEEGNWYIVPIMTSHYLQKGETAESLSKKYYGTNKKSALILDFNKRFDADTWIYIPFGE